MPISRSPNGSGSRPGRTIWFQANSFGFRIVSSSARNMSSRESRNPRLTTSHAPASGSRSNAVTSKRCMSASSSQNAFAPCASSFSPLSADACVASPIAPLGCRSSACHANGAGRLAGQPAIILLHCNRRRCEVCDLVVAHMLRIARQHDRCFHGAAMNPVTQFFVGEQAIRRTEPIPSGGGDQHAVFGAQVLRRERHRCAVAAVTGHDHEFLNAGARDAFADRGQVCNAISVGRVSVPGKARCSVEMPTG